MATEASRLRVAVIGGGWAGLAAAVQATALGHRVTLVEMARQLGGRARSVATAAGVLDNGQHILIGAYTQTLALMRQVGVDPAAVLLRRPLALTYPDGSGLVLPPGPAMLAFLRGAWGVRQWRAADRLALLQAAAGWGLRRFSCDPALTVQQLCAGLPAAVLRDLVEPLCVAALNTPMAQASASVFLRVMRDALFAGPGSADLLLPRAPLSSLLPDAAQAWLQAQGATLLLGQRVGTLQRVDELKSAGGSPAGAWLVDGQLHDAVILACSAVEAGRLAANANPAWAETARKLAYQPIVTVYLRDARLQLPRPMLALHAGPQAPAQFVFDLGALGMAAGCFAFVVSGAQPWVDLGLPATADAVLAQARQAFAGAFRGGAADAGPVLHVAAEKRATFACTPGLQRPAMAIAPGLLAAGDHVQGPYPATLEGAVRAGRSAALALVG